MTIIFENFTDIVGKAIGGYVKIRSADIRPGVKRSGMVTNHTIVVDLVDGHFRSPELDPGPTVITLRAGYVRKSWTLDIPLEGEHELWPLVVASNEYTPEVVGQAQAAASAAATSARHAEDAAQSTSSDRQYVTSARDDINQIVSDGAAAIRAQVKTDADRAEQSATSAAAHLSTVADHAQQVATDSQAAANSAESATTAANTASEDALSANNALSDVMEAFDVNMPILTGFTERTEAAAAQASGHAADVAEKHQQVQSMYSNVEQAVNDAATVVRSQVADEADRAEAARTSAESHAQQATTKAGEVAATAATVEGRATDAAMSASNAADSEAAAISARDVAVAKAGEASTSATSATGAQTAAEAARDGARAAAIDAAHQAVAEKFAEFIDGAPEMLDTWMEVVDAIQSGDTEIAALTAQLATKISGPYTIAVQAGGTPAAGTPSNQITFVTEVR